MARGRFPQGPTASRPVGKLHTFGVVDGNICAGMGAKSIFGLPSLAAQLRACVYPFTLQPQVSAKKKCTSGLVLATPVVFTWGFFPFCQQLLFAAAHKPAPQERGDCSFQSQTPLAAAPYGLACSTFVSVDKMSERRQVLPLMLLRCDGLCTPQEAVCADKYIYQCCEVWWNCCR